MKKKMFLSGLAIAALISAGGGLFMYSQSSQDSGFKIAKTVAQQGLADAYSADSESVDELGTTHGWETNDNNASPVGQVARTHSLSSDCPSNDSKFKNEIVDKQGNCNINSDIVIDTPLELSSFTKLKCHGHKIMPSVAATGSSLSVPQVAITANNVEGIEIEDCIIGDETHPFSMGIHIQNSKPSSAQPQSINRIHGNEVAGLGVGISLLATDEAIVENNKVTYYKGAQGMQIIRGSRNQFLNNEVKQNVTYNNVATPAFLSNNTVITRPTIGIFLDNLSFVSPIGTIITPSIFPGVSTNFPLDLTTAGLSNDNIVRGNMIYPSTGLAASNLTRAIQISDGFKGTVVDGNTIYSSTPLVAGNEGSTTAFGMLVTGELLGSTFGVAGCTTALPCIYPSINTLISNNKIHGYYSRDAIQLGITTNVDVRDNEVTGGGRSGILIGQSSLGAQDVLPFLPALGLTHLPATVTHNKVYGNGTDATRVATTKGAIALFRNGGFNSNFGAKISENDFAGNTPRPIGVNALTGAAAYTYNTELSQMLKGNYWGRSCADDAGFNEFDAITTDNPDDSPVANVLDSHPFGASVLDSLRAYGVVAAGLAPSASTTLTPCL
jgi:hypothetical protein